MDFTDMSIAGNLLGETGLAGVEVYGVMTEFLYFAGIIIANGSANFFAAAAGRFDKSDMTRWFSNGLASAIACGVFCSLVSLFLCKPYLSFVGVGGETLAQARSYWLWYGFQALVQPLAVYLAALVYADADRATCTVAFSLEFVVNAAASYFLCRAWGIAGCSVGTAIGSVSGIAVLLTHFFRKDNSLVFRWRFSVRDAWRVVHDDFSESGCALYLVVIGALMNYLLVRWFGDSSLAALAIVVMVYELLLFLDGIPNASRALVGVYAAEGNFPAVRDLAREGLLWSFALGSAVGVLLLAFPSLPVRGDCGRAKRHPPPRAGSREQESVKGQGPNGNRHQQAGVLDMKLHFLGFGAVARSLARMIRDRGTFPLSDIAVIDRAEDAGDALAWICGSSVGFTRTEIRRDNLDEVLRNVKAGDIVFNLGDMLGARSICAWCLKRDVHYLSASSDDFPDGELATPSFTYDEYVKTRRMFDGVGSPAPSTVVSSGMNPGAVSLFAKRAIAELSGEEPTDFAAAARKLGVASVDITDIDDTELRVPREPRVVYSTWSPREFFVESTLNAEATVGCGVPMRYADEPAEFADKASGFVSLKALAYERPVRTVGLGREGGLVAFFGATVAHDEIVSIPAYLSVRENGRVVYRPESRFIYRACAAARASVAEIVASGKPPLGYHLITADEIASGGEARAAQPTNPLPLFTSRYNTRTLPCEGALGVGSQTFFNNHASDFRQSQLPVLQGARSERL